MVSLGSIIRFGVGIILSAEIIRGFIFESKIISDFALTLSIGFIFLSVLYFAFRF